MLVEEFIPGPPLSTILDRRRLSINQAHALACQLLLGLVALERARIVHCDYKPGNIIMRPLLGGGQRPVLVDFGAGRLLDGHAQDLDDGPGATDRALGAISDHLVVGTLAYMAPEQFAEGAHLSCAVDLYALGAILFRALRGEHVFGRLQGPQLVHAKLTREAPWLLGNRAGSAAQRLERVIARALRCRVSERYQHAEDMLADLMAARPPFVRATPPPLPAPAKPAPSLRPAPPPIPHEADFPSADLAAARRLRRRDAKRATATGVALVLLGGFMASGLSPRPHTGSASASAIAPGTPAIAGAAATLWSEEAPRADGNACLLDSVPPEPHARVELARVFRRRSDAPVAQVADPEMPLVFSGMP